MYQNFNTKFFIFLINLFNSNFISIAPIFISEIYFFIINCLNTHYHKKYHYLK